MFLIFLTFYSAEYSFFTGVVKDDGNFPKPLSAEDEKKYLALAKQGDQEAKNMLVRHNMRLVAHIVKKIYGRSRNRRFAFGRLDRAD